MFPNQIDRYQIVSECGRGGMAVVYKAIDPQRQQNVALKVLLREYLHDPQFRARFKREIDIHTNFRHEAVVPIYGYGQSQGQLYLVLGYMAGGSLEDRMRGGKALSLQEVLLLLERVAPALDAAHRDGIIHRDLKPSNVLFDEQGRAFLSDFGIARIMEQASQLTGNNMIGSPAYMSPEQARTGVAPDKSTDMYSLGVMVYEMLTGSLPYLDSNPVKMALKHITEPVPDILTANPMLPAGCREFIFKALAKKPDERFSNATEMTRALAEAASRPIQPLQADRAPLPARTPTPSVPRPRSPAPAPEPVPTPRPIGSTGPRPQIPSFSMPAVSKSSLPSFLRPFARYLRLPSWLRRPSVPYLTMPAPLRPLVGFFGIPSTITLPKNLPGCTVPSLTILIILFIVVLLVALVGGCYWLIFIRQLHPNASGGIYMALQQVVTVLGIGL